MKLQVITTLAVISGFFTTTSADAGKFNLGQALQTAQQIGNAVNTIKYGPQYKTPPYYPGNGYPGYGTTPGYVWDPPPGWQQPPVYQPPVVYPPQPQPGCHPPVNLPPVKTYKMVLQNNTGAEVYYNLDNSKNYHTMPKDDVDVIQSQFQKPHLISYHNGHKVVQYELNPNATYSFEWQGDTLQLLEIQS
jgi:hypothetical protein